jgi:hypothetical protein
MPFHRKLFIVLLSVLVLTMVFLVSLRGGNNLGSGGVGYLEAVNFEPKSRQLHVSGWLAPQKSTVFATNLIVRLGSLEVYRGRFERSERPDVAISRNRPDWLSSGFGVRISVPERISGKDVPVSVGVYLSDGSSFDLLQASETQSLNVPAVTAPPTYALIALGLGILSPVAMWFFAALPRWRHVISERWFFLSLAASFCMFVAGGWTGSSMGLLLKHSPMILSDAHPWLGKDLPVRSDEWAVLTPFALAQAAHDPPFPIVNRNLGSEGQNMLVVGMTSVPVKHVSVLARPATWGWFFLDVRRALAWHWWFPFFACYAALCLFFTRFFLLHWKDSAVLALILAVGPYSVGWSGWPAYTLFFALAGILVLRAIFFMGDRRLLAPCGLLLGACAAGFVLVLYPSWQISVAYVTLPFGVAWVLKNRKEMKMTRRQWSSIAIAILVAVGLVAAWYLDAEEAVAAIRHTVYPGGRSTEVGGDIDPWFFIKGWLSPTTMYLNSSSLMVPSDASSYLFLLPATVIAIVVQWVARRRVEVLSAVLILTMSMMLWFMFLGFTNDVSRWTLWGSATTYRMDLALGLVQVLMLAWLCSAQQYGISQKLTAPWCVLSFVLTIGVLFGFTHSVALLPTAISELVPMGAVSLAAGGLAVASLALLIRRYSIAIGLVAVWGLAAVVPFNPLTHATQTLRPAPDLVRAISNAQSTGGLGRIAVIGQPEWAMVLPAAGFAVINSVFYYPQEIIWNRLDPDGEYKIVYNRYHRLHLVLDSVSSESGYTISTPRLDEVRVTLNPDKFNFRLLGADFVMVSIPDGELLMKNSSLVPGDRSFDWMIFSAADMKKGPLSRPFVLQAGGPDLHVHAHAAHATHAAAARSWCFVFRCFGNHALGRQHQRRHRCCVLQCGAGDLRWDPRCPFRSCRHRCRWLH